MLNKLLDHLFSLNTECMYCVLNQIEDEIAEKYIEGSDSFEKKN